MLGEPSVDPLTIAIDRLVAAAAGSAAKALRRARSWAREQDPATRLGTEIISGAQQEMLRARANEALARIDQVARGQWWLASALTSGGLAGRVHLVAAGRRIAAVEASASWKGQRSPAPAVAALLDRLGVAGVEVVSVIATADGPTPPRWSSTGGGNDVLLTAIEDLAGAVEGRLDGSGPFDPLRDEELARVLSGAQLCARQRSVALSALGRGLDLRSWVIAPGTQPPGVPAPIDVLAIGPTGIFVCEVAGLEPSRAARHATAAARTVALEGRGLDADVIPAVLCEPGGRVHQIEGPDGHRAWALPLDQAARQLRGAGRDGLKSSRVRRVRHPAPGWRYGMANTDSGLIYEIHYDLATHRRTPPPSDS